jgi:hypothetical protein
MATNYEVNYILPKSKGVISMFTCIVPNLGAYVELKVRDRWYKYKVIEVSYNKLTSEGPLNLSILLDY